MLLPASSLLEDDVGVGHLGGMRIYACTNTQIRKIKC